MTPLPTLSVLTPTYNRRPFLLKLFRSLSPFSFIRQWVIVDDGSTDDTAATVSLIQQNLPPHLEIIYVYISNSGMKCALNTGFPYLTSEFFVKIDSDDFLTSDFGDIYSELFLCLQSSRDLDHFHHISLACTCVNHFPLNSFRALNPHPLHKHMYILTYAKDRLYESRITGDLMDIFPTEPVRTRFRYPFFTGNGHCPTGILHMYYILTYPDRQHLFYNRSGLYKQYLPGGITSTRSNNLRTSPLYYLLSSSLELRLPGHSVLSYLRSIHTFLRATFYLLVHSRFLHFPR